VVRRLDGGAQDHVIVDLPAIGGVRAGGIDVHPFPEPARKAYGVRRLGDGDHDIRVRHAGLRGRRVAGLDVKLLFKLAREGLPALRATAEDDNAPDRPHGTDCDRLGARLPAGADDGKRMGVGVGHMPAGEAARSPGAHLPEQISLDHRLEPAVERGIEQRVELRPLQPGIVMQAIMPSQIQILGM